MPQPPTAVEFTRQWAGKATSIAIAMVAPGVLGMLGDRRLHTTPVLSIAGFVIGFCYGLWRLVRLANHAQAAGSRDNKHQQDKETTRSKARSLHDQDE